MGQIFYVYVLQSLKDGDYYIGYTKNLSQRLAEHNRGKSRSVKNRFPFKVIYKESYSDKYAAIKRERQIKNYKGGEAFKKLICRTLSDPIV
ncbi:MAG: GIY-YIG nuclease family protein [Candidatus Omnitrophica bacterium]|nr:GIY-YIG nuclease family protein [Candidatus Omnitrophota bacterium]